MFWSLIFLEFLKEDGGGRILLECEKISLWHVGWVSECGESRRISWIRGGGHYTGLFFDFHNSDGGDRVKCHFVYIIRGFIVMRETFFSRTCSLRVLTLLHCGGGGYTSLWGGGDATLTHTLTLPTICRVVGACSMVMLECSLGFIAIPALPCPWSVLPS